MIFNLYMLHVVVVNVTLTKGMLNRDVSDDVMEVYVEGLKATNEQQDNGTGILHQIAQHLID